jgi:arylsulfatase A-like enzyme
MTFHIEGRRDVPGFDLEDLELPGYLPDLKPIRSDYAFELEGINDLDRWIHQFVPDLERRGLKDATIIFTSDNGGLTIRPQGPTNIDPLRAGKGSAYEGGVRIPTIIKWPGEGAAGAVSNEPIITADFYPTILEITGAEGDDQHNANLDGRSLAQHLREPDTSLDREALYWHYPHYHPGGAEPYSAVRAGDWRLLHYYDGDRLELYNLEEDLGERNNLVDQRPEKAKELKQMLDDWRQEVDAQPPRENPLHEQAG